MGIKAYATTSQAESGQKPRRSKFAAHLDRLIQQTGVRQVEIARHLGYERQNVISMFKQGLTPVPLDKVPALARALGVDPGELMIRWMTEFRPGVLQVITDNIGMALSKNEQGWVLQMRKAFDGGVPAFNERHEEVLARLVDAHQAELDRFDGVAAESQPQEVVEPSVAPLKKRGRKLDV